LDFHGVVLNEANDVSSERGVDFAFDAPVVNTPARSDAGWTRRLEALCETSGIAHTLLASGAGHDAAISAHVGIPTAMLFIRNRDGSHNPREDMSLEDFVLATRVLMRALTLDAD
jgi:N-carbamoyl-L-amino-acid hydrolase